eukprot:TRINITY_DN8419_c0_g1_i1.p1 TRINITY_DN8419_c0_g1~~TRINITY_DN8419_c0_g1_i1.p1  ORF type:complete len:386 (-),score=118.04 TRINITY_DN8419_c0_g1_i1:26-1183(-)
MSKKNKNQEEPQQILFGRVKDHLKMGIVGLPNVGKSSLFNLITAQHVRAENYPFCTIDPNNARVTVPDRRLDWLDALYSPPSKVYSYLEVVDIAGLVRGASEGEGLGNAFLSHINGVDGIYHVIRTFKDPSITHVEGDIDPIRDLDIIENELRLKDIELMETFTEPIRRLARSDPKQRPKLDTCEKALQYLRDGINIRAADWHPNDISIINEALPLTSKPVVYLVNLSRADYIKQRNKWLPRIKEWIDVNSPGSVMLPFSVTLETEVFEIEDPAEKKAFLKENKTRSILPKIITSGFSALNMINFFTAGTDEVRAWVVRKGAAAPRAAGRIHTDFEKKFIRAEVMAFDDLEEHGNEQGVRSAGKYRTEGKNYIVQDGDIMHFRHN